MLLRAGDSACTDCTRYGAISVPLFAIAAASMASCIGVTSSLSWPIADSARSEGSDSAGYRLATTGSGTDSGEFQPNRFA